MTRIALAMAMAAALGLAAGAVRAASLTPTLTPWIVYGTPTPLPGTADARALGNKFRPLSGEHAHLAYSLPLAGKLRIQIYSRQGVLVKSVERDAAAGQGEELWDGRNEQGAAVAAGIYAVFFQAVGLNKVAKLVVIK